MEWKLGGFVDEEGRKLGLKRAAMPPTPVSEIKPTHERLRRTFDAGVTRVVSWRYAQLRGIERMMVENRGAFLEALHKDLRKPTFEGNIHEVETVLSEVRFAMSHLASWMAPEAVTTPSLFLPASSYIVKDPVGVVCIITAWNYPINLPLVGLVAALSAGNAVLLKPSEVSSASEQLLASLLPKYVDPRGVGVVIGGVAETTALLTHRFDSIMYTGNTFVGKIVMAAAAKFLTPVILELGGKNPVIVDRTANIDAAAQRIMRGRCLNAGQTCIAPEVVYVEKGVEEALLASMVAAGKRMFGEDPRASPHMGRIVNKHHWSRVMGLVKGAGGQVVWGGGGDEGDLYIAPTIIKAPSPASKIMREEVFGPVVCVQCVESVEEAIAAVNQGEKPLSLYIFSTNGSTIKRVLESTSSGGAMVNDTIVHFAAMTLPFGGVGESGMGAYHGKAGFDALSHKKSVMHANSGLLNVVPRFLDPPYYQGQDKITGTLISWLPTYLVPQGWKEGLILGLSVAVVVLGLKVGGKV